ncbi:MAG: hypothetical protein B6I34_04000 [Anaerolineaceae bacterium 4572_32.1]|nr:MAG: hypothetical protein B6I34_04000 [Anaerolineaceae bacterium 4572_32.1]
MKTLRKNKTLLITLAVLALLFLLAVRGMSTKNWVITLLRGLSVGAITFLVASGFSLIFGLMDVLNLAHGTFYMIGAYVGWTVAVRPDTAIDALTPVALLAAGLALISLWGKLLQRLNLPRRISLLWPWAVLLSGALVLIVILPRYPITTWDIGSYEISPTNYAFAAGQGQLVVPEPEQFKGISPALGLGGILLGGVLLAAGLAGFAHLRRGSPSGPVVTSEGLPWKAMIVFLTLAVTGIGVYLINTPLTEYLLGLDNTWLFLIAIAASIVTGVTLGALMESTLIRPLYATPIYQLMLTLGVSAIGVEIARTVWGATEFTMPRPSIFNGRGEGCPAESLGDWLAHKCSTVSILGGRVRTYNEIFVPILGLVVLVLVWILLRRTRMGMIVRAGVQDREMVQALGINVQRVFTLIFALGVGLAALGGVIGAPTTGLTTTLGESLLLNVLIALAIGGLTSYPGAAVGSLIVGLLQQFIIKYGQLGIKLPFLAEPFKPTPPLVPASTVLLMVVILLVLPHGLFGKKE